MTRKVDAIRHFKRVDPHFHQATLAWHGAIPVELPFKRTRAALFESLVETVISQQLGAAASDTIFARVKEACNGRITSLSILKISPEKLRAAGLSGAKIKTIKEISKAIESGSLDLLALKQISEAEAAEKLMSIWGLGPWSVDMFMIFGLGRADVFSVGDLGLVRSMEAIYALPKDAPKEALLAIAEKWSPHRTYASLLLWRCRDKGV
ncbi:MAG TPA: DNA-3-methyladenine glycosylase 2 family protein [Candidatus Paceibacterota bacterium]